MSNVEDEDPLIDEVRRRRRELFQRHNSDLRELHRAIKALQDKHPDKVVKVRRR
ncbi:MAG: hypothetical protein JXQ29_09215 [Planctomycetes bacterium]|nr:hypothetical protein [Planctomycetota bacterium]